MTPLPPSGPIEEVTVALNKQRDKVVLDVLGRRDEDFQVPFTPSDVERALDDASPNRVQVDPLVSVGTSLFGSLFASERGAVLWEALDRATRQNGAMRLRITTNVENVQHLPWELLYDPSRKDFISLSGRVALVRTRPDGFIRRLQYRPKHHLRLLAVTADPTGALGAEEDLSALERLAGQDRHRLEFVALRGATSDTLMQALSQATYDVFVFFGTGVELERKAKGGGIPHALQLVPRGASDRALFDRNVLGRLLGKAQVRLAVMAGSNTEWVARSLAKQVPAAIGFREVLQPASRQVAVTALYAAIAAVSPLDVAVGLARKAMDRALGDSSDWCRLIFYMQPADGNFLLAPAAVDESRWQPNEAESDREVAKLLGLHAVYRSNLEALQRASAPSLRSDAAARQASDLQVKVEALEQQISAARRSGGSTT